MWDDPCDPLKIIQKISADVANDSNQFRAHQAAAATTARAITAIAVMTVAAVVAVAIVIVVNSIPDEFP